MSDSISDIALKVVDYIKDSLVGKKKPKKDKFEVTHRCHYVLANGNKCDGRILENNALDAKIENWCGRQCKFMAEYFANVYAPDPKDKK